MAEYEELLAWATEAGVQINGISPRKIPGAGLGIVATRDIKENELIVTVPAKVLRTVDTVPKNISSKLPDQTTVHSLLALDIALDPTSAYTIWKAAFPSLETFETCMPMLWPESTFKFLPLAARKLVQNQKKKLDEDWLSASAAFPELDRESYTHAWLLVSTRTFYYATPKHEKTLEKEDRMALQPVADLFNHSSRGCHVRFNSMVTNGEGFAVVTDRKYKAGEEVVVSYGYHSNDFLLAEYGFCMQENEWDEVCIDEIVMPSLTTEQKDMLDAHGFLGSYVLDGTTPVCYRTEVALRAAVLGPAEWTTFVEGMDDGEASQVAVDRLLLELLAGWEGVGKGVRDVKGSAGEALRGRMHQIAEMVRKSTVILRGRLDGT